MKYNVKQELQTKSESRSEKKQKHRVMRGQLHPAACHYKPIENYGIIGDMHTAALVGMDGSIDWCCLPDFDSPSVFARLLDVRKGGYFQICPGGEAVQKQMYLPESCILMTRFFTKDGVGEVMDFMVPHEGPGEKKFRQIIRCARAVKGKVAFQLHCEPAFDYARARHTVKLKEHGAIFASGKLELGLTSPVPLKAGVKGVTAKFTAEVGRDFVFILRQNSEDGPLLTPEFDYREALARTLTFWRNWIKGCSYRGRWREMIQRSAMTLKLLTYAPTGAIIAAPTTSLPETVGGARNFDYRYTWIRDAAFTVYAFLRLGLRHEAEEFLKWIDARAHEHEGDGSLQIMYGIRGEHDLEEIELKHLEGYRRSAPVRIGNQASNQLQLDIYGELMDAIYLSNKHTKPISYDVWRHLSLHLDYVCDHWMEKDEGIWEVRGGQQHFVYSKLMCWVALDRGLRLADKRSFPADRERWLRTRDDIYREIMEKGWSEKRQCFVQHYGSEAVDASNLIMPLVFFVSPTDPRMLSTIEAVKKNLVSDSLVYRYEIDKAAWDGFHGKEGTFSMCTFWLVEALTRSGQLDEARLIFEKMHSYSNHLGLYSEEIGATGEALGNFPQAFTHLSMISAAFNLNRALGE